MIQIHILIYIKTKDLEDVKIHYVVIHGSKHFYVKSQKYYNDNEVTLFNTILKIYIQPTSKKIG